MVRQQSQHAGVRVAEVLLQVCRVAGVLAHPAPRKEEGVLVGAAEALQQLGAVAQPAPLQLGMAVRALLRMVLAGLLAGVPNLQ